jgi:hypothetical protein
MTAVNRADICDTKVVRHKYEILRANALGSINRAPEFTLFLRNGMSAWLRALAEQRCIQRKARQKTTSVFAESDGSIPGANLASILTDAILNAAGRDKHMKGNT